MSSNEILTFQFGHYSNFVGAHWWNIQESSFNYNSDNPSEINHDVLFREGLNLKNEVTFTPRLLLVDLKGSLKTLQEDGELYQPPKNSAGTSCFEVHAQQPPEKTSFLNDLNSGGYNPKKIYNLEKEVKVWSDYLYTRFHPRTINVIKEYQHGSESSPFDIFPLGANLWKKEYVCEDFVDKIRNYIEECNNFQGFQVLLDSGNAFSGLAISCLEYLRDEYGSKAILAFPVNPEPYTSNPLSVLTTALCFEGLGEHSNLFSPLSVKNQNFDNMRFEEDLWYHSSAILASALDTLSLNYRLKESQHTLIDICSDFSTNGRKAVGASVVPLFPIKPNEFFIECLDKWEGPIAQSITPNCKIEFDNALQLLVLRGVAQSKLKDCKHASLPAYSCNNVKDMLGYYLQCTCYQTKSAVTTSGEKMSIKPPFPRVFSDAVGESVPILAGLHTGKFVGSVFGALSEKVEGIKFKQFHQFLNEGIENDQLKECFDKILDMKDCYEDSYLM